LHFVVFYNLSSYDTYFIIKKIATAHERYVELLPITKEKSYLQKMLKAPKMKKIIKIA